MPKEIKKHKTHTFTRISLEEYETLRQQANYNDKAITDPEIIKTIDQIEELVASLRKRIVRKDIFQV